MERQTPWIVSLLIGLGCLSDAQAVDPSNPRLRPPAPPMAERICPLIISVDQVRPHVIYLASPELGGRTGDGGFQAGEYVAQRLREAGLAPLFDGDFFQAIPGSPLPNGETPIIGRNVGAVLEGSDPLLKKEYILIGAHYDHLGFRHEVLHPGADDNASGVAMLLEAARYFSHLNIKPKRSLAFVAFDLEEELLYGSRWYVAHPPIPLEKTRLMIAADMISRSLGGLPLPAVFVLGSEHAPQLRDHMARVGIPTGLEVARLGIDFVGTRSDYGPFRDRGVPFLFFSTGEHPDYHTPRDTPERVDFPKLARISSLITLLVQDVADSPTAPAWTAETKPDLEEARVMLRITDLLLNEEAAGRMTLTSTTRFVANQANAKTRYLIGRGTVSVDERVWLRRSAQYLLLSAF